MLQLFKIYKPLKNHGSLKVSDRCVESSEVWKTRLWSLSSVWTRAVQLEDEKNQHLALVPGGNGGMEEELGLRVG